MVVPPGQPPVNNFNGANLNNSVILCDFKPGRFCIEYDLPQVATGFQGYLLLFLVFIVRIGIHACGNATGMLGKRSMYEPAPGLQPLLTGQCHRH